MKQKGGGRCADTGKKEYGDMEWSATRERGAAGLACLIHRDIAQKIQKPEGISERLLNIKLELKDREKFVC